MKHRRIRGLEVGFEDVRLRFIRETMTLSCAKDCCSRLVAKNNSVSVSQLPPDFRFGKKSDISSLYPGWGQNTMYDCQGPPKAITAIYQGRLSPLFSLFLPHSHLTPDLIQSTCLEILKGSTVHDSYSLQLGAPWWKTITLLLLHIVSWGKLERWFLFI